MRHQLRLGLDLNIDQEWGHWFSGFVDGEGNFGAYSKYRSDGAGHNLQLAFIIQLRADDLPLLKSVRATLQVGSIRIAHESGPSKPKATYRVRRLSDLYHVIVPLFDHFPLHSKKARDFAIWREIVELRHQYPQSRGGTWPGSRPLPDDFWARMDEMTSRLRRVRRFIPPPELGPTSCLTEMVRLAMGGGG